MRGAQPDDQTRNAAHTQSVLTPVAGSESFVPSGNYATKPRAAIDLLERLATEARETQPSPSPPPMKNAPAVNLVETDKLAFSVREASRLLGVSRGTLYTVLNEGRIPAVKFGKWTLIPANGLRDWLSSLPGR
jgi:excisionase family DNA binding protein